MMMIIICFIVAIIFYKYNVSKYMDILTLLIFIVQFSYETITENEPSSQLWVNSCKLLVVDLLIFSSVFKWAQSQMNGTGKPYLIISVFFLAFFLSQFSIIGDYLGSIIDTKNLPTFSMMAYFFFIIFHFRKIKRET